MLAAIHTRDYAASGGLADREWIAALLAPIPGDRPCGEFLRHEGTYDQIAEARREDDERLEQGIWKKEIKRADWTAVARLCGAALEQRTKDLQIAAWLTEAWCRLHGFPGLNAGLSLILVLSTEYWADLYPPLDDVEYRIVPFHWINEKLAGELQFISLTQSLEANSQAFTWADWESANRFEQQRLQRADTSPAPGPLPAQIQHALRLTPPEWVGATLEQIAQAAATAIEIESFLDGHIAAAGPSLRQLRTVLGNIQQWLSEVPATAAVSAIAAAPAAGSLPPVEASSAAVPPRAAAGGSIHSREEAYRQLSEAAAYLMRTEPHSPAPYLVHRAIRWGSLPLDQLLPELVRNEGALGELQQLLNLKKQAITG